MRILYISYCPPLPTWGGAMAFHRHFIERADFEVRVVTNAPNFPRDSVSYDAVEFGPSAFTKRLFHTRLMPWMHGPHSLTAHGRVPEAVWSAAREFKPDAVFTIAGSWDYSALVAQQVARRLGIPLVASFNDWFDYASFLAHRAYKPWIESRFRRFYREADLALCTCEGMRDALGAHPNHHVLYPIGANRPGPVPEKPPELPFTILFGGNLADWYGPMIEELATTCKARLPEARFRIYGNNPTWSAGFGRTASVDGTFGGSVPFSELRERAIDADVLLLPMGFGDDCAHIERTSFKTKFLDYLSFDRPILVWGPEYCSAVRIAREFDSAEICTDRSPEVCAEMLGKLMNDKGRRDILRQNAETMYQSRFHPDVIHSGLVAKIKGLTACQVASHR